MKSRKTSLFLLVAAIFNLSMANAQSPPNTAAPVRKPASELDVCLAGSAVKMRDCFSVIQARIKSGEIDLPQLYADIDARVACDKNSLAPVLEWFYGPELDQKWLPRAKDFLLRCFAELGDTVLVDYAIRLFVGASKGARLNAKEWESARDYCRHKRIPQCLEFIGTPGFDQAFANKDAEIAFIKSFAEDAPEIQIAVGGAIARISANVGNVPGRLVRLGYFAYKVINGKDLSNESRKLLVAEMNDILRSASASAAELNLVAITVTQSHERDPSLKESIQACVDQSPERTQRHEICELALAAFQKKN